MSAGSAVDDAGGPAAPAARVGIRIESLSDMVFGLALSIGSLVLVGKAVQSGEDLGLNVLLFGFGFLIILMTWLRYSRTMAVLPVEVPFALLINCVLLFLVALEPYLFYVLWSANVPGLTAAATAAYGLDIGAMLFSQAALAQLVLREDKARQFGQRPLGPSLRGRFRSAARTNAVMGCVYVVSALPVFWVDTPIGQLRYYLWGVAFLFSATGLASGVARDNAPDPAGPQPAPVSPSQ